MITSFYSVDSISSIDIQFTSRDHTTTTRYEMFDGSEVVLGCCMRENGGGQLAIWDGVAAWDDGEGFPSLGHRVVWTHLDPEQYLKESGEMEAECVKWNEGEDDR